MMITGLTVIDVTDPLEVVAGEESNDLILTEVQSQGLAGLLKIMQGHASTTATVEIPGREGGLYQYQYRCRLYAQQ